MIDFQLLKKIISDGNSFLITTHVNPDADALGSEIALYLILKELGKESFIVNYSVTPYNLLFLDKSGAIETYDEEKHSPVINSVDVIIALDFNRWDRTVKMKQVLTQSKALKICIDHHLDPENFADHFFIDTDYSAPTLKVREVFAARDRHSDGRRRTQNEHRGGQEFYATRRSNNLLLFVMQVLHSSHDSNK